MNKNNVSITHRKKKEKIAYNTLYLKSELSTYDSHRYKVKIDSNRLYKYDFK